jgi:hypothetical protein
MAEGRECEFLRHAEILKMTQGFNLQNKLCKLGNLRASSRLAML